MYLDMMFPSAETLNRCGTMRDFGNRDAMRYLGILYANGTGVKKDTKRAMELFAAAAKKGDKEAASYYEQLRLDSSVPAPKSIK